MEVELKRSWVRILRLLYVSWNGYGSHEIESLKAHTEIQRLIISLFVNVPRFQVILHFITYARKAHFAGARSPATKLITGHWAFLTSIERYCSLYRIRQNKLHFFNNSISPMVNIRYFWIRFLNQTFCIFKVFYLVLTVKSGWWRPSLSKHWVA